MASLYRHLMKLFLKSCLRSFEENKLDLVMIGATVLVFCTIGAINSHWDYLAPVIVSLSLIVANHLVNAAIVLQREVHQKISKKDAIPHYRFKLWTFVGIILIVLVGVCAESITRVSMSEKDDFLLKFHDHITIGHMVPHVSPLDPSRLQFFPQEREMARMEVDVEIENNLQPVTLMGQWGFTLLESGVSRESEKDAIKHANDYFKTMSLANAYKFARMSPQDKTSFTIYSFPTYDQLNKVIKKDAVFYVVGLVVFKDTTGTYEQQVCRAITIRDLPEGKTIHYERRCDDFNDEIPRNPKLTTFR